MTRVLLYSGGVDSMALSMLWPHDTKLYVDMCTKYSRSEKAHLTSGVQIITLPLTLWERPDGIIPCRNLILTTMASIYGDTIAFGAIAGERMLDKTPTFAEKASDILSYLWAAGEPGRRPQGWTEGREIKVELPIVHLTKAQLIKEIIKVKGRPAAEKLAREAWSCYDPVFFRARQRREKGQWTTPISQRCGKCKPCLRNWLAFHDVGIEVPYKIDVQDLVPLCEGRGEESAIAARAIADADDRAAPSPLGASGLSSG